MKNLNMIILVAIAVTGCVYPFEMEDAVHSESLVVEGDILIGDVSKITLGTVQPLNSDTYAMNAVGRVWIEDENGKVYEDPQPFAASSFSIDMTEAPSDVRYRLRIKLSRPIGDSGSTEFSSEWVDVQPAPVIDALEKELDTDDLSLLLSLSSPGGSGCFRWDYDEIWEFHAELQATVMYNFGSGTYTSYDEVEGGNPYNWCWGYASSTQAGLAIAKSTGGEKLVDRPILSIPRSSNKLQTLYYVKVKARDISEACYEFLHAIEVNSTSTGSLTTPDPSKVVGNIRSDTDPSEFVVGYIEAARVAIKEMFIDKSAYKPPRFFFDKVEASGSAVDRAALDLLYSNGYRPYFTENLGATYLWAERRCVDCTANGGTKTKPDFWPSDHK